MDIISEKLNMEIEDRIDELSKASSESAATRAQRFNELERLYKLRIQQEKNDAAAKAEARRLEFEERKHELAEQRQREQDEAAAKAEARRLEIEERKNVLEEQRQQAEERHRPKLWEKILGWTLPLLGTVGGWLLYERSLHETMQFEETGTLSSSASKTVMKSFPSPWKK